VDDLKKKIQAVVTVECPHCGKDILIADIFGALSDAVMPPIGGKKVIQDAKNAGQNPQ
jgi:hypothetical protein